MATMISLLKNVDEIVQEAEDHLNEANIQLEKEFQAAVRVQAWFRGSKTRSYLGHLNRSAVVIQKRWRGYIGRRYYRILLLNTLFIVRLNHFNKMATLVQKTWRAYYTRKYIFNYYSRKRYLEGLQIKNEIIRSELNEFAEHKKQYEEREQALKEKAEKEYWARKNHHLISTEVIDGIYNSKFLPYPMEEEFRLRLARPLSHSKPELKSEDLFDPACRKYGLPRPNELPPLVNKPQGPFRDPADAQTQRYKPFQPSLRVATSFESVEQAREMLKRDEWVMRINDNIFKPFSKKHVPYDSLLHTTSKYGHLPYGTQYFREEFPMKFTNGKTFKGVVPQIPIFEKLNDTYSQGQV